MKRKIISVSLYVFVGLLFMGTVYATSKLTPPGSVTNTMYSLTDIYNLGVGTTAPEGTGAIETTPETIDETGKTLTEVYTAISNEITAIDATKVLNGNTIFGKAGTMPTRTLSSVNDTVSAGYYAGTTLSTIDTDLAVGNIKNGVNIFGVSGTASVVDTADATAGASDIISPKTAYVNGVKITGLATAGTPPAQWAASDMAGGYQTWTAGDAYCTGLGGGWRLPYLWELSKLQKEGYTTGSAGLDGSAGLNGIKYWSGMAVPVNLTFAYNVTMDSGYVDYSSKTNNNSYVRCAR